MTVPVPDHFLLFIYSRLTTSVWIKSFLLSSSCYFLVVIQKDFL